MITRNAVFLCLAAILASTPLSADEDSSTDPVYSDEEIAVSENLENEVGQEMLGGQPPQIPDVIDPNRYPSCQPLWDGASKKRRWPGRLRHGVQCIDSNGDLISYFEWYFTTQDGGVKKECIRAGGKYTQRTGRDECEIKWDTRGHALVALQSACWTGCNPKYGYCNVTYEPYQSTVTYSCSVDGKATGKNRWTHIVGHLGLRD